MTLPEYLSPFRRAVTEWRMATARPPICRQGWPVRRCCDPSRTQGRLPLIPARAGGRLTPEH